MLLIQENVEVSGNTNLISESQSLKEKKRKELNVHSLERRVRRKKSDEWLLKIVPSVQAVIKAGKCTRSCSEGLCHEEKWQFDKKSSRVSCSRHAGCYSTSSGSFVFK